MRRSAFWRAEDGRAAEYIEKIDAMGGAVPAIEAGYYQDEIHEAAFRIQQGIESGERVVVGVNRFVEAEEQPVELQAQQGRARRDLERDRAGGPRAERVPERDLRHHSNRLAASSSATPWSCAATARFIRRCANGLVATSRPSIAARIAR